MGIEELRRPEAPTELLQGATRPHVEERMPPRQQEAAPLLSSPRRPLHVRIRKWVCFTFFLGPGVAMSQRQRAGWGTRMNEAGPVRRSLASLMALPRGEGCARTGQTLSPTSGTLKVFFLVLRRGDEKTHLAVNSLRHPRLQSTQRERNHTLITRAAM